ncbi:MAG: polyketide synthase, partial [Methylococcales bacterium]|nr:polyketide synthase [Methylococcales bacterium]
MFDPIAIIGSACLLPGANNPDALWSIALHKQSAIGHAPIERQFPQQSHTPWPHDLGGYITDFNTPQDGLDNAFHWLHYVTNHAFNNAGVNPAESSTGLICGHLSYPTEAFNTLCHHHWLAQTPWLTNPVPLPDWRNRFMSGLPAHWVADQLGLKGKAMAIDAACASSLYAIQIACFELQQNRSEYMIAAGLNAADRQFLQMGFNALSALSLSGQSRPFHPEADGLLAAEGAAAILLCPLSLAKQRGHSILGVIEGIGVSNDGQSKGFLAPAKNGQIRAMTQAYANSAVLPEQIRLLECHATGTSVGDQTELDS